MPSTEKSQSKFFANGKVRYYSLARYAFLDVLRIAEIKHGSLVLLPEYLCGEMLTPLYQLGAIPCWYAVTEDLSPTTKPVEWPVADAVLMVNYFGFPQDLRPFLEYRKLTGAIIVEDNAHGYLSRDDEGLWLGCRTGLGLFSIRKTLRIPNGAMLWVGESYVALKLPVQYPFMSNWNNNTELIKARIRQFPVVGDVLYRFVIGAVRIFRKGRAGNRVAKKRQDSERKLLTDPNPWSGLLGAIDKCSNTAESERRRFAYKSCLEQGRKVGAIPVFRSLPLNCVPYAYAFRGNNRAVEEMQKYSSKQGFDLYKWPSLPTEISERAPLHYRNVYLVNFLW